MTYNVIFDISLARVISEFSNEQLVRADTTALFAHVAFPVDFAQFLVFLLAYPYSRWELYLPVAAQQLFEYLLLLLSH